MLLSKVFPPETGGSGRWFWEIYRRLPCQTVLLVAGVHPAQEAFDRTHDLNIIRLPLQMPNWGVLNWPGVRRYWYNYQAITRLVRSRKIDQIHCGCLLPEGWIGWLLKKRFGIPYLCYVHGEETSYVQQSRELTWMTRRVLGSAQVVIANSRNTFQVLRNKWGVADNRLRLLYPGVDVERFVPAPRDLNLRSRLGWQNRSVLLTVGRLQARKGQDHLILALHRVRRSVPDVLYVIVGDGERRNYLEQLVREQQLQDHVAFLGDVNDETLIRCFQQCDLFVLPNREVNGDFEGFGMVLLEARPAGVQWSREPPAAPRKPCRFPPRDDWCAVMNPGHWRNCSLN